METFFAPADRKNGKMLLEDIDSARCNPIVDTLLQSVSGLLAVLNEERQILAVNDAFLHMLGIRDGGDLLGLRPGESVNCVHAHDNEGGCGTGRYCSSCGAAIAIVTALAGTGPVTRKCVIEVEGTLDRAELYFDVRADTFDWEGKRYILLFLRDISREERSLALEGVFFHDLSNTILALSGLIETNDWDQPGGSLVFKDTLGSLVTRLRKEVEIQKSISAGDSNKFSLQLMPVAISDILEELERIVDRHPAARRSKLVFSGDVPHISIDTDHYLLVRILANLVINALEAGEGGTVKVWAESKDSHVAFSVWNRERISREAEGRVFQKYFTTKGERGRGFGTYSAKFFGEKILGGRVSFETSEENGTTFSLVLPVNIH